MNTPSRQVRRQQERRANKTEPSTVQRTSSRHMGKTKGLPFSRKKLEKVIPSESGKPAVFVISSYTTKTRHNIKATAENIDWFFRGITPQMKMSLLGMY